MTEPEFRPEAVAQVSRTIRAVAEWVLSVHDLAIAMFQVSYEKACRDASRCVRS